MQTARIKYFSRSKYIEPQSYQVRELATHRASSFGSNSPPPRGPLTGGKSHILGKRVAEKKTTEAVKPRSSEELPKPTLTRRIPYGKVLIFGLFAYVGYRVYHWQTNPHRSRVLDPKNFTPFILEKRDKVSSTSSILNLQSLPKGQNADNITEAWEAGVWSVQVMQPELQIARSYTPLPPKDETEPEQMRLFVREEPQGEVSGFLHRIFRGTLVHCRGPQLEYAIPEDVDEVLFLAGGTGISPALQVAHTMFNHRKRPSSDGPRLHILWANRRREDSFIDPSPSSPSQASAPQVQNPLVEELESLKVKYDGKVNIDYFVDDEGSYITKSLLRTSLRDLEQNVATPQQDHQPGKKLILISGPEGFISFFAGPKYMKDGREVQGPLGGLLQELRPEGWTVRKI